MFNTYDEDFARESAIASATAEAKMLKLSALFEATELNYRSNLELAKARVLSEYGSRGELMTLFKEASDEANEKKAGIISRMIEAVKELIAKIKAFIEDKIISRFKNSDEASEQVAAPKGAEKVVAALKKAADFLIGKIKAAKNAVTDAVANKTAKDWAPLIAGVGSLVALTGVNWITKGKVLKLVTDVRDNVCKKLDDGITELKKSADDIAMRVADSIITHRKNLLDYAKALLQLANKFLANLHNSKGANDETVETSSTHIDVSDELDAFFESTEQELAVLDLM